MKKLMGSFALKATAFIGLICMLWVCVGGALGVVFLFDMQVYTKSESTLRYDVLRDELRGDAQGLLLRYLNASVKPDDYSEDNLTYEIYVDGIREEGDCARPEAYSPEWTFEYIYTKSDFSYNYITEAGDTEENSDPYEMGNSQYTIRLYVDEKLPVTDTASTFTRLVHLMYSLRFAVYVVLVLAALMALVCFIYLMVSAGHRAGVEGIAGTSFTRLPLDLVTAAVAFCLYACVMIAFDYFYGAEETIIACLVFGTASAALTVGYFITLATRIKLGGGVWWRNTVICRVIILLGKLCRLIWRGLCAMAAAIPLAWGAVLIYMVLSLTSLIWCVVTPVGPRIFGWILLNFALFPSLLYICVVLQRLLRGCDALAGGKLDAKVDTKNMFGLMRRAGEDLNNIGEGMTLAVEERLRSERLKTELITNVSHDIKTPLTSIINYADLISREQTDNPQVQEYSVELLRQSERMKKLIEDLIEASKASTGNIEMHMQPCEIGVLLTQCGGEYQSRLEEAGLYLVTSQPDEPLYIMADGSRLWRVLDNLLGNALKYALPGTRVYLSLERQGSEAVITLKNVSAYPLNMPADELLERFTRGDSSRSTGGNGLGLSIAKSLTELQGGTLTPVVDGDLFKIILRFKLIAEEERQ